MVLDGVKYRLVPMEEENEPLPASNEVLGTENDDLVNLYTQKGGEKQNVNAKKDESTGFRASSEIKKGVGRVSEYRQRFKEGKVRLTDISTPTAVLRELPRQDTQLDAFTYGGKSLFFGPGLEQE